MNRICFTVVLLGIVTFGLSSSVYGALLFKDNFNTLAETFDINPDLGNDNVGRQTGSVAPLDYLEFIAHTAAGAHDNMSQINNPDYSDALLLAPSNSFGFENTVAAQPDHNFIEDPGAGNMMVISYDANPVHDVSGVQVTDEAPVEASFAGGLEFLLYDGGDFAFFTPTGLVGSGDLEPTDPGGLSGTFAGYHNVRIELITDAWTLGNALDVRVFVDNSLVDIDTDGTPKLYSTAVGLGLAIPAENFIVISGDADPDGPGGGPVFTLHGIDNLAISIAPVPEPGGFALLVIGAAVLAAFRCRPARRNRTLLR